MCEARIMAVRGGQVLVVEEERSIGPQRRKGLTTFRIRTIPTKGVGYGRVELEGTSLRRALAPLK